MEHLRYNDRAMITEERVHKAVGWLVENARLAAEARGNRLDLEEATKSLLAILMREHLDLPLGGQEREARADVRFAETHLRGLKEAIIEDEYLRRREKAELAVIDVWRSQNATDRALKIG